MVVTQFCLDFRGPARSGRRSINGMVREIRKGDCVSVSKVFTNVYHGRQIVHFSSAHQHVHYPGWMIRFLLLLSWMYARHCNLYTAFNFYYYVPYYKRTDSRSTIYIYTHTHIWCIYRKHFLVLVSAKQNRFLMFETSSLINSSISADYLSIQDTANVTFHRQKKKSILLLHYI